MRSTVSEPTPQPPVTYEELNATVSAAGEHFDSYDVYREQAPLHFGHAGDHHEFWFVTRMEDIRGCLQDPSTFSNSAITPDAPEPAYFLIPEMLDPPLHTKWRQKLGPFFARGAVERLQPRIEQLFNEILDEVAAKGECDFVAEVALRFPNTIFMEMMGLPVADAAQFQVWERHILHEGGTGQETAVKAMQDVMGYFAELIAERHREPRSDMISSAITWDIDGEPVRDSDLLSFCLLMFMAGLDTVAMQLAYSFWHLARHPADRRRLVEDPSLVEPAVEEFLRYYAFVSPGRMVMTDTTIAGCPVRKGQMIWMPLSSGNRDPREFPDADRVLLDRSGNRHLSFGAGPHRCLGSHLARQELTIALREWHKRIPDYRLDERTPVREHGGQVGLDNLPLVWDRSSG